MRKRRKSMDIRFRRAEEADIPVLETLTQQFIDQLALDPVENAARDFVAAAFDRATPGRGGLFVVEGDGRVVGVFHVMPHLRVELGGATLFLEMVCIEPSMRGRGIGRAVFRFLGDYAERNRFRAILFEMEQGDPRLTEFFADAGFEYRTSGVFIRDLFE